MLVNRTDIVEGETYIIWAKGCLYSRVQALWEAMGDDMLTRPPHIQPIETEIRKLDQILAKRFQESVEQWREGLISSDELLTKLIWEASKV